MTHPASNDPSAFEVRFNSLFAEGRALAFPCDAQGRVDLNHLPNRARCNYLFARTMVGRDFSPPQLCTRAAPALA